MFIDRERQKNKFISEYTVLLYEVVYECHHAVGPNEYKYSIKKFNVLKS